MIKIFMGSELVTLPTKICNLRNKYISRVALEHFHGKNKNEQNLQVNAGTLALVVAPN